MKTLIEDLIRLWSSWSSILNGAHFITSGLASFGFQSEFVQKRIRKRKTIHEEAMNTVHFQEDKAKEEVKVFNAAIDIVIRRMTNRLKVQFQ